MTISRKLPVSISIKLACVLAFAGCGQRVQTAPSGLPMTSMQIGSKTYQLEIAADNQSREKGLMERDTLASDHGMIFIFLKPELQTFWMHNTRFPLDIIFADDHARVVSIHTMKALDEHTTYSDGLAKYAIELSKDQAATTGVKIGDELQIPDAVKEIQAKP